MKIKFKFKKISLQKIYNFVKQYYLKIAAVIFIVLIAGNVLVYFKYIYLPNTRVKLGSEVEGTVIDKELLEKVLSDIEIRENNLNRVESADYRDPFR